MPTDIKRPAISITIVVCAALFWIVARQWMYAPGHFDNWPGIIFSGALLTLLAAVMALGFFLLSRTQWISYVIAGILVTFLTVNGISILYMAGAVAVALVWWQSSRTISQELNDRRKIRVGSVLGHGMSRILLGLYLMLSFAFYLAPDTQNITQQDATQTFQHQLDATSGAVLQSELAKLPPSQREQVKRQISSEAVKTFVGILNFRFCLTPGNCTPSVLDLLPPLYAFLFFLTIWGFGFIFRELGILVGIGIFSVLQRFHVVSIAEEDAKVQVLKI
jgi:hypothetical protein